MITRRLRVTAISRARRVPVESGPYLNRLGNTRRRGELNAGPTRLAVGAWAETGRRPAVGWASTLVIFGTRVL